MLGARIELRESDHLMAQQVRREFRLSQDEPSENRTIKEEDVGDFAEFIGSYGV
jgi:hypothetical protein